MSTDTIDIVAYIEKDIFEAPGVCITETCKAEKSVNTDSKTGDVTVSIPLMKPGDVVNAITVSIDIIKVGQTQTSCLICRKPCSDSGVQATPAAALSQTTPITPTGSALPPVSTTLIKPDPGQPLLPATHQGQGCAAGCPKLINWAEDYDDIGYLQKNQLTGLYTNATYKRSRLTLTTEVDIPQICGMFMLSFSFEISPCYAYWDLTKTRSSAPLQLSATPSWLWKPNLQGIPSDNSLKWVYPPKWSFTWNFTQADMCFYPGEAMALYAHVNDPSGKCKEILVGYGWFETSCLTSGIIQGCGLLKKNTYKQNKEYIPGVDRNGKRISRQNISNVDVFTQYKGHYTYISPEYKVFSGSSTSGGYYEITYPSGVVDMYMLGYMRLTPSGYVYNPQAGIYILLPLGTTVVYFPVVKTDVYHTYKNYTLDATNGSIQLPWDKHHFSVLFPGADLYLDYTWQQWDVLAGGYLQPFNVAWVGDPDLYWLVSYKGSVSWVKCADYTEYNIGDRVLIYKGGKGTNPLVQKASIKIKSLYNRGIVPVNSTFLLGKLDIVSAKVTMTANPSVVYEVGRDYLIDSSLGKIEIVSTGKILSNVEITVEYTYRLNLGKSANDFRNCRLFDPQNTPLGDETLASSNVSFTLDIEKDVILPQGVR